MTKLIERLEEEERFWLKVDRSGDCWEWLAGKTKDGYGRFWFDGKMRRATHFAIRTEGSDVPSGLLVLHHCDNPGCVNPDHLWLGTHIDNNRDREKKGRGQKQSSEYYRGLQKLSVKARLSK